ncbi:hypothetical protein BDZ89DRAFT_1053799 [Hymenopellis radicata]|nr:hypothetical protein BDZ89DRAFT_1053799 [Hymenopellis radicata]
MESLPDEAPPPPPPANRIEPAGGAKGGQRGKGKTKAPPVPAEHHNRWTTREQYDLLDTFRPRYLELRAKKKLNLLWPEVENTFLARWPVSVLCTQLKIEADASASEAPNNVAERNVRKPETVTGMIKKDAFNFNARTRVHHALEIFQRHHRGLIDARLETIKKESPEELHITLFRRASNLAWEEASAEVREACMAAVEEEKKEKEELKLLEKEENGEKRTPEQYANALALMPGHINMFASKLAERTGQMFLITSVGPDERGCISSQSYQFGPSYAQVNDVGHTFEQAYSGFKSYFMDKFEEYGKGCFSRSMREDHVPEDRRRKTAPVAPVNAPDDVLINESAISAPVLTGLVETEDGLDIRGPDTVPQSTDASSPSDATWTPDPYVMKTPDVPLGPTAPVSIAAPSTSSTAPPYMTSQMGSSMTPPPSTSSNAPPYMTSQMESSMILPPSTLSTTPPYMTSQLSTAPPYMTSQMESSMTLPPSSTSPSSSSGPSMPSSNMLDWEKMSPADWEQLDQFMTTLPSLDFDVSTPVIEQHAPVEPTTPALVQENSQVAKSVFTPSSVQPASSVVPFAEAPKTSLFFHQPTPPIEAPPPSFFGQIHFTGPPIVPSLSAVPAAVTATSQTSTPTATSTTFTPLTAPAWNPLTRILKPAAPEEPMPSTTLTAADVALGGSLMGEKTPPPELPAARSRRAKKTTKKTSEAKSAAGSKNAAVVAAPTPAADTTPSSTLAPPLPVVPRPVPRPTPRARVLSQVQPSIEETQDSLGRRSNRKRGAPLREPVPLSSRSNKENIPPWVSGLSLGMRSRAMGDEWDVLVRTYERLEGDMNEPGVPLQHQETGPQPRGPLS